VDATIEKQSLYRGSYSIDYRGGGAPAFLE
jgi:hypothetical protein